MQSKITYNDIDLILTWPDATIRGDERWMMFFKKIGIVKNLDFKVGHTGIVIIKRETGEMLFYDFGRYITPRRYGRARSKFSDPRLDINLKAKFENERITNLEGIIEHSKHENLFVRRKHDIKLCLATYYFQSDHSFNTSQDYKVAKIIANDSIQVYIEDQL